MRSVVVLPQPDGPSRHTTSAGFDVEVDVVDRGERAEVLAQVAQLDIGHGRATA